mgnify:FL=1
MDKLSGRGFFTIVGVLIVLSHIIVGIIETSFL